MRTALLSLFILCSAGAAQAADLTLTVIHAADFGPVRGMVFGDADSFDRRESPVAKFSQTSENGIVVVSLANLPPGRYAVALYQDRNGNDRLDKTMFGLPTEPYGFSNDASAPLGPPDFDQAAFVIAQTEQHHAITITLR
ncbi:DUF2141 domain-containing protein [Magnetospirillum fulvum]|uniref:Uncharacterized conserved protein, DUF2141 family n=1 Tax=Magnetospirillum fulvum TaxID=1082 RepID=A0A1H6IH59_MAGFU|nr:DUF2141 domain-containing protein [Magnetospirillum fulvum]SEH48272.1 Uncharacterized conserved protein, DUF2141 family [Magnetospirillum fulvum]